MKLLVVGLLFIVGKVNMSANISETRTRHVYTKGNVATPYSTLEPGHLKSNIIEYKKEFPGQEWQYHGILPEAFPIEKMRKAFRPTTTKAQIIKSNVIEYKKEFPGQEWQYHGILPEAFPIEKMRKAFRPTTTKAQINHKLQHGMKFPGQRQYDGLPIEFPTDTELQTNGSGGAAPGIQVQVSEKVDRRVYHPDEASSIEDYPFMAALLVNKELWCGAVIITRDKVLTAAHCLQLQYNNRFFREYVKVLSVRVGSSNATFGGDLLRVSEIMFHPNYRPQTLSFNFALLKLHKNMTFGKEQVRAEAVPYSAKRTVAVDTRVQFLGWGSSMSTGGAGGQVLLQRLSLPVYDLADCQHVYGRELVTRNNFCAGYITVPKNVCNHDAGGPAIMDGVLIGILSFSSKTCDERDHPAVFSTVGAVTDWLEELID